MGLMAQGKSWGNLNKLEKVLKHRYAFRFLVTVIRHDLSNVNFNFIRLER